MIFCLIAIATNLLLFRKGELLNPSLWLYHALSHSLSIAEARDLRMSISEVFSRSATGFGGSDGTDRLHWLFGPRAFSRIVYERHRPVPKEISVLQFRWRSDDPVSAIHRSTQLLDPRRTTTSQLNATWWNFFQSFSNSWNGRTSCFLEKRVRGVVENKRIKAGVKL